MRKWLVSGLGLPLGSSASPLPFGKDIGGVKIDDRKLHKHFDNNNGVGFGASTCWGGGTSEQKIWWVLLL